MSAALASFRAGGARVEVMFNPASLKISLSNRLQSEESGKGGKAGGPTPQATQATTTKLETELVFDSTDTGQDVRTHSNRVKDLARTDLDPRHPRPQSVEFRWGRFSFTGVIESLNETLDFWSAEGVPLRSTLQLTISGTGLDSVPPNAPRKARLKQVSARGTGVTGAAQDAGDPGAARAVAARNGVEDMRMPAGGMLGISADVSLQAAAGFNLGASASAGASAGAGFGIGATAGASASLGAGAGVTAEASAGFSASAGAGFSAGAGAGFTAGASFNASAGGFSSASFATGFASAGVSASGGAFAGLGVSRTATASVRLDPERLSFSQTASWTGGTTQFDVTGRAVAGGGAGLSANVSGTARAGVRFT